MNNNPTLWVFAGINGAGKSTIQQRVFDNEEIKVINADLLAAEKPLLSSGAANTLGGGREAIQQVREALKNRESFSIESTLGGKGDRDTYALKVMQQAKDQGYQVRLMYVALNSVDTAKERVIARVAKGGHDIPAETIERRYPETLGRLQRAISIADNAYVYDNTGRHYQLIAQKENDQMFYFSPPEWIEKYLPKSAQDLQSAPQQQEPISQQKTLVTEVDGFVFDNSNVKKERLDLDALAQAITTHYDGEKTHYSFNKELAFFDYGQSIRMATEQASQRDEMVLIALQTAALHHKSGFKIVGSDEFKDKALSLIAEYDLKVTLTDKSQLEQLEKLKQDYQKENKPEDKSVSSQTEDHAGKNNSLDEIKDKKPEPDIDALVSQETKISDVNANSDKVLNEEKGQDQYIRGELVKTGKAPFEFKEGENESPYIVLKTDNKDNRNITLWGVDFPRAIAENDVKLGDLVKVKHLGKKPVTVSVPVRDENNKIIKYKEITTIRNTWEVKPEYPKPTKDNPDTVFPKDFKGYDIETFKKIQGKVHEKLYDFYEKSGMIPSISNDIEKYKGDYIWFYPNGKPVPDSVTKPLTPPNISDYNRLSGQMVFTENGTPGAAPVNSVLVAGRDGYLQGVVRDPKTDVFHDVIVPINTKMKDGIVDKTYVTFAAFKDEQCNYMAYGNMDSSGNNLKYKVSETKDIRSMKLTNHDFKYQNSFEPLFENQKYQAQQRENQQQEEQHVNKKTKAAKPKM
ncbi:LPD7 domain-containing protein [Xenorhabdus sp. KJ12.1]|uniref:LPD7 domain-containing protein n=1 Tax=Xenorhabdus sp. KJ12.1 TaxID=1851571 RepID=UPI000C0390AD|nr:LPD7 domain-containing protein [Xenorhabdus sp. KJ12.1]PHM68001.1 DNA primase [Xenorhabdus sp. KJ12.1]